MYIKRTEKRTTMAMVNCSTCGGSGQQVCSHCGGQGQVWHDEGFLTAAGNYTCAECGGAGSNTCVECGGTGQIEV